MAAIDMVPITQTLNLLQQGGLFVSQAFTPKSSTGAGIDLTGATFGLTLTPMNRANSGSFAIDPAAPTIVSASAGKLVLSINVSTALPANGFYTLTVTPPGGSNQLLASGTFTAT